MKILQNPRIQNMARAASSSDPLNTGLASPEDMSDIEANDGSEVGMRGSILDMDAISEEDFCKRFIRKPWTDFAKLMFQRKADKERLKHFFSQDNVNVKPLPADGAVIDLQPLNKMFRPHCQRPVSCEGMLVICRSMLSTGVGENLFTHPLALYRVKDDVTPEHEADEYAIVGGQHRILAYLLLFGEYFQEKNMIPEFAAIKVNKELTLCQCAVRINTDNKQNLQFNPPSIRDDLRTTSVSIFYYFCTNRF